jgi:hypothetical protein
MRGSSQVPSGSSQSSLSVSTVTTPRPLRTSSTVVFPTLDMPVTKTLDTSPT